jgi:hypothetical protein
MEKSDDDLNFFRGLIFAAGLSAIFYGVVGLIILSIK